MDQYPVSFYSVWFFCNSLLVYQIPYTGKFPRLGLLESQHALCIFNVFSAPMGEAFLLCDLKPVDLRLSHVKLLSTWIKDAHTLRLSEVGLQRV